MENDFEHGKYKGLKPGYVMKYYLRETLTEEELKDNPNKYLYKIKGFCRNTRTYELMVVFESLFGEEEYKCEPLWYFINKVEPYFENKHIKQKLRYERVVNGLN